jgi:uncharacterized protein
MTMTRLAALAVAATLSLPAYAQDRTGWPNDLTIGTASQGGTYFVYGNGFASYHHRSAGRERHGRGDGRPGAERDAGGNRRPPDGLVTMGPAYDAWNGKSELAPGLEHKVDPRAVPDVPDAVPGGGAEIVGHHLGQRSGGKRVSVGPAGGTPGTYWPQFMTALGVKATVSNAGAADAAGQLADGLIDAFAFAAGVPISAFAELAASQDVVMFGFNEAELPKVLEAFPAMAPLTIPAGTYAGP